METKTNATFETQIQALIKDADERIEALLREAATIETQRNALAAALNGVSYTVPANTNQTPAPQPTTPARPGIRKADHRDILRAVKRQDDWVSVSDIREATGCEVSSRELTRMVNAGLLIRMGTKRWARYRVAA